MSAVQIAFASTVVMVNLESLLPSRRLPAAVIDSVKFKQIMASIQDVGLIEPLSVIESGFGTGQYVLLDGHVRLVALQVLGYGEAPCLIAKDDEAYTYNSRINRLSTIQETRMLQEAVEKGVSKEHLAKALNIDSSHLQKKLNLLEGICPEVAELLKDRQFSSEISRVLRKMKSVRQVECVDLMLSADSLTVTYAEALLAATPIEMLVEGARPSVMKGITSEQMARMEREMANLQGQFKQIEETYAEDVLNLILAQGYLTKLFGNEAVKRYIKQQSPEICEQMEIIASINSLDSQ
jgi:hypothetical protein